MADVTISYKGSEIASMSATGTKTLLTEAKYCEDDIVVAYTKPSAPTPTYQAKTNITPTTSSQTITADAGYDALSSVQINAMPSGSAATPATTITANPTITVSSGGLITATASASKSVTPTVSAGYVSAGTAGTVSVSGSNTSQLTAKAAATYTPTTADQTIASGQYLTGAQTIKGDANLLAENIKDGVSIFSVQGNYTGDGGGGNTVTLRMYDNSGGGPTIYCPSSAIWTGWDMDPDTYEVTGTLTISENDLFVAKCPIGVTNPSSSVVTFTKMTGLGNRVSSDVYLCYTGTSSGTVIW